MSESKIHDTYDAFARPLVAGLASILARGVIVATRQLLSISMRHWGHIPILDAAAQG